MFNTIKNAIDRGDLLKIDYRAGQRSLNACVIRPLSIEGDSLNALVFATGLPRKLSLKRLTLHDFTPRYVDGAAPDEVDHLRWYIAPYVTRLFDLGFWMSSDEEYIGIYPRTDQITAATDKPFTDHLAHLQYIKSPAHAFHVWDESGNYARFNNFEQAMDAMVTFADNNKKRQ